MFHHANIVVPRRLQAVLQCLLVTPDAHRVHHSQEVADQSSNYGVTFPWWDMAFGTYRLRPACNSQVEIGLKGFQKDERSLNIGFLLLRPLLRMRGPTID
jgi:sterol desaturase/sphingolipid hydroxylase (fatty acid hydroxylase superfamily)